MLAARGREEGGGVCMYVGERSEPLQMAPQAEIFAEVTSRGDLCSKSRCYWCTTPRAAFSVKIKPRGRPS